MSQQPSQGETRREPAEAMAALLAAIKASDVERVQTLLQAHPELVEGSDQNGDTPLMLATYYHADEIARLLLEHGAPISLFEAAAIGDVQRARQMLDDQPELGASISHDGWTPLHLAAHFGQLAIVDLLLSHGADVDARSANGLGNTPLHAALAGGHRATAERLVERRADVNAVEEGGYTPLHQAADLGDVELVRMLLARGARIEAKTDEDQTPQDLARAKGHTAVAEQLSRQADGSG